MTQNVLPPVSQPFLHQIPKHPTSHLAPTKYVLSFYHDEQSYQPPHHHLQSNYMLGNALRAQIPETNAHESP